MLANQVAKTQIKELVKDKKLIIKDIKGLENLEEINSGAMLTCNHFNPNDSYAVELAFRSNKKFKNQKLYRIIREGNYTNFPGLPGFFL